MLKSLFFRRLVIMLSVAMLIAAAVMLELAAALGQNPEQVFKTLVTVAKSGEHYVFLVPVAEELDLKKDKQSL